MSHLLKKSFAALLVGLIRFYQWFISPLLGPHCRYYPSCSEYARHALQQHGIRRGLRLATWRILRCNPFSYGGVDPVPNNDATQATSPPCCADTL